MAAGETATFTGPAGIANVIGRVTGGNPSTIAGTLRSTVAGANVTLINPAGIAVTQGARIDVPGAFRISTADEVRFADGATFSATNPDASTLTHAPPVAFGFLGPARPITITGATIDAGGIGVAGGAVTISGSTLSAPGGEIRITATAGAGEVKMERAGPPATVTAWAPVRIDGGAVVSATDAAGGAGGRVRVRGSAVTVSAAEVSSDTVGAAAAGQVKIRGDSLLVDQGAAISANSYGSGGAGSVGVHVSDGVRVRGGSGFSYIAADGFGAGNAGSVAIDARGLAVETNAYVSADGVGSGGAGTVIVRAPGDIAVRSQTGSYAAISATAFGNSLGAGGAVTIEGGTLSLGRRAFVEASNYGFGQGGTGSVDIRLSADLVMDGGGRQNFISAASGFNAGGPPGSIRISARDIIMRDGATIDGSGDGYTHSASVELIARGLLQMGVPHVDPLRLPAVTSIRTEAYANSLGNAGDITIRAGRMEAYGAGIAASTLGFGLAGTVRIAVDGLLLADGLGGSAGIGANTFKASGDGGGGAVQIRAGSMIVRNGMEIQASTTNAGDAGDMTIDVAGELRLEQPLGAAYNTLIGTQTNAWDNSPGGGAGGRITVNAGSLVIRDGAQISSSSGASAGNAGAITVNVAGSVDIAGRSAGLVNQAGIAMPDRPSGIFSESVGGPVNPFPPGTGNAGAIAVNAGTVALAAGGGIGTSTLGPGNAGNVRVNASRVSIGAGSEIASSSAGSGRGGDVLVNGGEVHVGGGGARIAALSTGDGAAGDVLVVARNLHLRDGGSIATSALSADGGNIGILIPRTAGLLTLDNGAITASVAGGAGSGGNIVIDPFATTLANGSTIAANAFGGPGGNVTLQTTYLFVSPTSSITASSALGIQGNVSVSTTPIDPATTLATLPSDLRAASAVLREACAVRSAASVASLVVGTPGGLPFTPEGPLPSTYLAGRPLFDAVAAPGGVAQALAAPDPVTPMARCG